MKKKKFILIVCLIAICSIIFHANAQKGTNIFHEKSARQEDKSLLYEETEKANAQRMLSPFRRKDKRKDYYERTGMYAFDLAPDHWYDPANKEDLRNQSIFLIFGIIVLSLLLKFWRIR
jgi:FtsZ-interacting cell division protein ZipA